MVTKVSGSGNVLCIFVPFLAFLELMAISAVRKWWRAVTSITARPFLSDFYFASVFCSGCLLRLSVCPDFMAGAFSILGDSRIHLTGRILVFTGAFLFYISDIFVARHRFIKKEFFNRLIGLPLYFTGQYVLAFSVGLLYYL